MALFLNLFGTNVPEHVEEEIQETSKGRLELLYGHAMQSNKAALDAEAEQGLHSPASPLDQEVASSPERPVGLPGTQEPETHLHETRRRRRRSSFIADPEIYVAATPEGEASPAPGLDFFSQADPDCYNPDGQPMRKPRWRPGRPWDISDKAHDDDKEFDSASEDDVDTEDTDYQESLESVDLESLAAKMNLAKQAATPRVSLQRASDKRRQLQAARPQKERPRQQPTERSAGAPQTRMGQATMEQMPEAAPKSAGPYAQGWTMPPCECPLRLAREFADCTAKLGLPCCCCSEGARKGDKVAAEELEKGLLGRLYKLSRRRRVLPSVRNQRAS